MIVITTLRLIMAFISMFILTDCADSKQKAQWDNIDYSKVRNRGAYENDNDYKLPSIASCTSDDLYTCN